MKPIKEIRSKEGELHFQRWALLRTPWFHIYLHCILKADQDKHCHDHPWSFISLILWGSYVEQRNGQLRTRKIGSIAYLPARGTYHKIYQVLKPTWTLVATNARNFPWGYDTEEGWIGHETYRKLKHEGYWSKS